MWRGTLRHLIPGSGRMQKELQPFEPKPSYCKIQVERFPSAKSLG